MANPSPDPQLLAAGYVLGDLTPEEGRTFQHLLAADSDLQTEITALQESLESVYGESASPPPALKHSILSAVTAEAVDSESVDSGTSSETSDQRHSIRRLKLAVVSLGAIAASAIIFLGQQNYTLRQSLQALRTEQAQQNESAGKNADSVAVTVSLAPTEPSADALSDTPPMDVETGAVSLVLEPDKLRAVLKAEGLPPLSADQVYVLWTVVQPNTPATTDKKDAILTTVFTVDDRGMQTKEIALPSVFENGDNIKSVAVSIESTAAPQEHRGSPILIKQL